MMRPSASKRLVASVLYCGERREQDAIYQREGRGQKRQETREKREEERRKEEPERAL
jgi:hypothetical protein